MSWQLEAEKVGGWEKGDHYSEALFLITLRANVFSIVFPFFDRIKSVYSRSMDKELEEMSEDDKLTQMSKLMYDTQRKKSAKTIFKTLLNSLPLELVTYLKI